MIDAKYDALRADETEDKPTGQIHEDTNHIQIGLIPNENQFISGKNGYSTKSEKGRRKKVGCIPVRYQLSFLALIGMTSFGAMRQSLGVAIVGMVNASSVVYEEPIEDHYNSNGDEVFSCKEILDNGTDYIDSTSGEFSWKTHTQEMLLSAFFYGYLCTQIPGGWISDKFGMKWVFGLGIMVSSVCALLGPWAARTNTVAFFISLFVAGLGSGVVTPAVSAMFSQWAHPNERSRLGVITFSGTPIGSILANIVGGLLVDSEILGGWPLLFYIVGSLGCIWFVLWCIFASSYPANHHWISQEELDFLETSLKVQKKKRKQSVPWLSILRSPVVWAIILCQFVHAVALFTTITNLPLYYTKGLGLSIKQAGLYSALPFALQLVCNFSAAYIADALLSRKVLSLSHTRKLMTDITFGASAIFLASAGFAQCNATLSVTFVTIAVGISGASFTGFFVSMLDIGGSYAGSVAAIVNVAGSLGGVVGPYIVGAFTEVQTDIFGWQSVLWIIASLYLTGALVYTFLAPIQLQPWARTQESDSNNM